MDRIVVVGQIGRDLVLRVDGFPSAGGSTHVAERRELLGGKGANQGVGLRQLGLDVALLGVVGNDDAGQMVLEQAGSQGIDVSHVARRGRTALLLDVVDQSGQRRLFEHVPEDALLSVADVEAASALLGSASTVSLQLQQPADALLAAAHIAHDAGARIVLDGTIEAPARDELLRLAHVVRADAGEAAALTGQPVDNRDEAQRAARQLLAAGAAIVAVEAPGQGDLVVWPAGMEFLPHASNVVDPTGGGDAFLAGLIAGLRLGSDVRAAAQFAAQAAASTVARLGGRPELGRLAP